MKLKTVVYFIIILMVTSSTILGTGNEKDQKNMDEIKFYINSLTKITYDTQDDPIEIFEGETYQTWLTVSWDPPDPQRPICFWANPNTLPDGATLAPECNCDYGQVSSLFEWTPSIGQAGTYDIEFEVGEACWQKMGSFILTIIVKPVLTPSINIDKWVSIDDGITWSKEIDAYVSTTIRFRITIDNNGDLNLSNIKITDFLPTFLEYMDNANPFEPAISDNKLVWTFADPLEPNENINIEFDAKVNDPETDENEVIVTADSDAGPVSDSNTAVVNGLDMGLTITIVNEPKIDLGIKALITNTGKNTIHEELECTISLKSKMILMGRETKIQISQPLQPSESIEVETGPLFGFGHVEITALIPLEKFNSIGATAQGFLGGPLIFFDMPFTNKVAVEWVNDYSAVRDEAYAMSGLWINDLSYTAWNVQLFYSIIEDDPYWIGFFNRGNDNAWEVDYKCESKGGRDNAWIDNVDIAYHNGHGCGFTDRGWGSCFIFGSRETDWILESTPENREASWGDGSLEWIVLDVCSALACEMDREEVIYTLPERWLNKDVFNGLHYILGFRTPAHETIDRGRYFAENLRGIYPPMTYNIRGAWQKATEDTDYDDDIYGACRGAYIRATNPGLSPDTSIDFLWGHGPVAPDPDPTTEHFVYVYWEI